MTAHKSFRNYINLIESFQQPVAEGIDEGAARDQFTQDLRQHDDSGRNHRNAMAGLQRTINFAKQHGYKIFRSPTGRKMRFVNTQLNHEIRAQVDTEGDSINVNFMDYTSGMSGNDDASYFDQVFKQAYQEALALKDHNQQTGFNDPGVDAEKYLEKKGNRRQGY